MPHLVRLGCAGVALIAIAALTSIGVYSVVAGGLQFGTSASRPTAGVAPVLVTIQAAPATQTVVPLTTSTPQPTSLIAGAGVASAGQPPAPALVAPVASGTPAEASATSTAALPVTMPGAISPSSVPTSIASPRASAAASPTLAVPAGQAVFDSLTLEIAAVERQWQAQAPDGTPIRGRDGFELLAIQVMLVNRAPELRYVADTDLLLVGEDGARYAPRQGLPLREPRLPTVPLPAGEAVRGWLTYEVPAGQSPRRLQWSPTRPDQPRAESTVLLALP